MFKKNLCLLFLATLFLFSCSSKTIKIFPTDEFTKEAKIRYEATLAELERNRRLWSENNIGNYEFHCEQFQGGMYPFVAVLIKVRDGKPFSLETVGKDNQLLRRDDYDKMTSFENMFDFLQAELDKGRILTVKYNKLGYPQIIDILYFYGVHGSRRIEVSKFEIIK